MDVTPTKISPEPAAADTEAPTRIQSSRPFSFTNGVLKRHHHHNDHHHNDHHHHHHNHHQLSSPPAAAYKECLKNHAASIGGHALDGCGEFMPSPSATSADPTSLKCAACGCHRNFHRRDPDDPPPPPPLHVIEYQPHHRHHPPPPPPPPPLRPRSPNSASPPPISSSYFPSAPHMLLALSTGVPENIQLSGHAMISPNSRKRFRTKFSQDQKEKMYNFSERVGWKMQKRDEDLVREFCHEIGVDKNVLKVWMHNNKNTLAKRLDNANNGTRNINNINILDNNGVEIQDLEHNDGVAHVATNGSSSSS